MKTVRSRSPAWVGVLLLAALRLGWRGLARLVTGFYRWLWSRDGGAFLAALMLVLIFGGLWLANTLPARLSSDPVDDPERTAALPPGNSVMARIGGRALTLDEVLEFARQEGRLGAGETLSAGEAAARGLVEDAIDQRLLAQAATDEGLMSDPDVRARLTAARNRILSAAYLSLRLDEAVTPEAARALYRQQRDSMVAGEELRLRELVVADAEQARDLSAAVNSGVSFEELVRNNSIAPSAADGGDLGYRPVSELSPAYAERVAGLSAGLYTLPFETDRGWVILKVEGRRAITPPAYGQLEDELMEFLRLRTIETTIDELRARAAVEIVAPGENGPAPDGPRQSGSLRE